MNILYIIKRTPKPKPWSEGEKIPWNDPEFSKRMLNEHLSQDHDMASRRFSIIDKHVKFIDELAGGPTKVLDLGCGPGFYLSRLTKLGYECKGIDFSPASIEYAKEQAEKAGQKIEYNTEDIRTANFGEGYGLVMMIYGEFNVFKIGEIKSILKKAYESLEEGGVFIAEPNRYELVKKVGEGSASWYSADAGLFSPKPHLCLMENFWIEDQNVAINRYFIMDSETDEVTLHSSTMRGYTEDECLELLRETGFHDVEIFDSLAGEEIESDKHLMVIVGRK